MNALVTGGGGFLGLYITEQLLARGDRVRVLCRGRYRRLDELGVECIQGDIRDASTVAGKYSYAARSPEIHPPRRGRTFVK